MSTIQRDEIPETLLNHASAGIRDSALTVHGNLQAERLGQYFRDQKITFTHLVSSNLQRAYKTALALAHAQFTSQGNEADKVHVTQLPSLREQDFGFYEGKPFYTRPRGSNKSGKEEHRSQHQEDPDFQDVESKESLALRADQFLDDYLVPLLVGADTGEDEPVVAVVSHGIMLSSLWRCLLKRFAKNSVTIAPGISVGGGVTPLEYVGGWSNTGFLELDIEPRPATSVQKSSTGNENTQPMVGDEPQLSEYKMAIKAVNSKEHLVRLKRTRGVGSSQHDEGQKKIETFFKRPKV